MKDGEIIAVWTYEKAKSCDFHHSFYITDYLEKINDEEYGVFWVNKNKDGSLDLDNWHVDMSQEIYDKLKKQLIK